MTILRSMHTGPKALDKKNKLVRLHSPINLAKQAEMRLRLSQSLQSSLDLRRILDLFFLHAQELVDIDGLEYRNNDEQIIIQLEKSALHHCDYRLITPEDNLGELVFSRDRRFAEEELATLELLIGCLIFPLRNALQYRSALQTAMRDPLTGIGNRAALDNALHRELRTAERLHQELSLLMIDIDHFKSVNDTHGHACGDQVIKQVAEAILAVTRQTDMTFRYGGEEFVAMLSNTPLDIATAIAERIRRYIETNPIQCRDHEIQTTISVGVSCLKEQEPIKKLFDRADRALYQAKHLGRNRVISEARDHAGVSSATSGL